MPIPEDIRIQLYKSLASFRGEDSHFTGPRWTDSEINSATKALAAMPDTVPALVIRAWHQASKANNQRAITITHPVEVEAVVRALPARLEQDEPCQVHGSPLRRPNGDYVCCGQPDGEPAPVLRRASPPPAGLRATVAAALGRSVITGAPVRERSLVDQPEGSS